MKNFLLSCKLLCFYKMLSTQMTILMNVLMTVYLIFIKNYCADCPNFNEIKDLIRDAKIENNRNGSKVPKFTLQTYAFVYQRLMDFPYGRFDYETLTRINLVESIHKIINVKIHFYHSHVTGKIIGYAQ